MPNWTDYLDKANQALNPFAASDADAAMLTPIRAAFNAARQQGGKVLYHYTGAPEKLLERGIIDPVEFGKTHEPYKPMGPYFTERPRNSPAQLSGDYKELSVEDNADIKRFINDAVVKAELPPPVIRSVIDVGARHKEIEEEKLKQIYQQWRMKQLDKIQVGSPEADRLAHDPDKYLAKKYTKIWQRIADVLRVNNMDDQPGLAEHIILNPDKANLFWENQMWNTEHGNQVAGPRREAPFAEIARRKADLRAAADMVLDRQLPSTKAKLEPINFAGEASKQIQQAQGKIAELQSMLDANPDMNEVAYNQIQKELQQQKKIAKTYGDKATNTSIPIVEPHEINPAYVSKMGFKESNIPDFRAKVEKLQQMTQAAGKEFDPRTNAPIASSILKTLQDMHAGPGLQPPAFPGLKVLGPTAALTAALVGSSAYPDEAQAISYDKIAKATLQRMKSSGFMQFTNQREAQLYKLAHNPTDERAYEQLIKLTNKHQSMSGEPSTGDPYIDMQVIHNAYRDRFAPQLVTALDRKLSKDGQAVYPKLEEAFNKAHSEGQDWYDRLALERYYDLPPEELASRKVQGRAALSDRQVGKALGIAGTVGLSALAASYPDEAQAQPLGKLSKQSLASATKMLDNPRSEDSFYNLVGKTLNLPLHGQRQPLEIVDVRANPKNDWRYVIVQDAAGKRHQLPMTKDYLSVLNGAHGTQDYLQQFMNSGATGKNQQALTSLTKREAQREAGTIPATDVQGFKAFNKSQAAKAQQIDPSLLHDYVYVRTKPGEPILYMPREYAKTLQNKGQLKIVGEGPKFK